MAQRGPAGAPASTLNPRKLQRVISHSSGARAVNQLRVTRFSYRLIAYAFYISAQRLSVQRLSLSLPKRCTHPLPFATLIATEAVVAAFLPGGFCISARSARGERHGHRQDQRLVPGSRRY